MKRILIVDDDKAILNFLNIFLLQTGIFSVTTVQDSRQVFKILEKNSFEIILIDMDMPNVSGLDILKYIKNEGINVVPIVLTGVEDVDLAISAMKFGTFDYLLKPINDEKLLSTLDSALVNVNFNRTEDGKEKLISRISLKYADAFKDIITNDPELIKIFHLIEKLSITDNSILIWGESGTGKELVARSIHRISNRKDKKFIAVNAGAFANELFSSEFFGHAKGSFTGAISDKKGFLEEAAGGTLFLDEIGELSLSIQVKLLRVLQEEEFYKLGSTRNIRSDVRIVAATNKNLFEEIKNGSFRKDLFYRLNINSIYLPPLRERKGDINLLTNHFLKIFNTKYKKSISKVSLKVMNLLNNYSYPGNVRELINIINSSTIVEMGNEIRKNSLPNYFLKNSRTELNNNWEHIELKSLKSIEEEHIKKILSFTEGNRTRAAEILGISRVNLISKIKKYNID